MAIQRPGVYVEETLTPVAPVVGAASDTVAAFIGANDRGPSTPTLVTSWNQYVNIFGSWNSNASNNLPLAVYLYFANGGSQAYVSRVLGGGATSATRVLTDRNATPDDTLRLTAVNQGAWGNNINVSITNSTLTNHFDLTVYFGGNTDAYIVEQFTDITMNALVGESRYAPTVINAGSKYLIAQDLDSSSAGALQNPSVVTNQPLTTGANGSAVTAVSNYSSFDTVEQSLVLNVPGFTDSVTVNAAISYAESRDDVFVVVDGVDDTAANQITLANSYTASSLAAVYYPQLTIPNPVLGLGAPAGATLTVGAGGAVAGLIASTDTSRGVFKAPAGLTARLSGAVAVRKLTNSELDSLNSNAAAVNAIRFISGSGIVVMGSRTLKAGYIDKYIPVRRTLIYLRKAMIDLTQFAIFEPNDARLWRRIEATISSFLTQFWSQGGLRGATPQQAFFVKVDATNNPQASIDNGFVNIEVGVALQRPAEFVVIRISQYDGGTTVTVA